MALNHTRPTKFETLDAPRSYTAVFIKNFLVSMFYRYRVLSLLFQVLHKNDDGWPSPNGNLKLSTYLQQGS